MATKTVFFMILMRRCFVEVRRLGFLRGFSAKKRPKKAKIG
jgi:hypothetical protein